MGYTHRIRKALISLVSLGCLAAGMAAAPAQAADTPTRNLIIHYYRNTLDVNGTADNGFCVTDPCGIYDGWNIWLWNTGGVSDSSGNDGFTFDAVGDKFGAKATIPVSLTATRVGFLVRIGSNWGWAKQDVPDDRFAALKASGDTEIWLKQNDPVIYTSNPNDRVLRIHYNRANNDYAGWDVLTQETDAADNKAIPFSTKSDCFGRVAEISVPEITQATQTYILRKGGDAASLKSHVFTAPLSDKKYSDVWINANLFLGEDVTVDEGANTFLDLSQQDLNPNGNLIAVHYNRPLQDYTGWNLKTLADGVSHPFAVSDAFGKIGCSYLVDRTATSTVVKIMKGANADLYKGESPAGLGGQRTIKVAGPVTEVWLKQGNPTVYEKLIVPDPAIQSAQQVAPIATSLKRGGSLTLPAVTSAKLKISWFALTPAVCSIKSGKLLAKSAGQCKLNASQTGSVAFKVFTAQYRIQVK